MVLPLDADTLLKKLKKQVLQEREFHNPEEYRKEKQFVGTVEKDWFRIYNKTEQPNNFMPLISGKLERTSVGCILFVKYRLFNSTNFFLLFWGLIAFVFGGFFIFTQNNITYGIISYAFGIFNYLISIINFNRHLKISRRILLNIIMR